MPAHAVADMGQEGLFRAKLRGQLQRLIQIEMRVVLLPVQGTEDQKANTIQFFELCRSD